MTLVWSSSTGALTLQSPTTSTWIITGEQVNPTGDAQITYGITSAGGTFNLRSTGTVDYEVEWGDGTVERSTSNTLAHTYAAGNYVLKIRTSQEYRPYFNNSTDEDQIRLVALVSDLDIGTDLTNAWFNAINMNSFDAAFGVTTGVTDFTNAWRSCRNLNSFPLIDTSSVTTFTNAWRDCRSLNSFPLIDTSSVTDFISTWLGCRNLNSFPLINTSSGTTFTNAWRSCTNLNSFPANFFDSWAGTPANGCFSNTWNGCSSLTATSVENILNSIDTCGQSAPASSVDITIDYDAGTGTPSIATAVNNLKARGWTITLNGVAQ